VLLTELHFAGLCLRESYLEVPVSRPDCFEALGMECFPRAGVQNKQTSGLVKPVAGALHLRLSFDGRQKMKEVRAENVDFMLPTVVPFDATKGFTDSPDCSDDLT